MATNLTIEQHRDRLEKGWNWLNTHPNHRAWEENFARWVRWLRAYEAHVKGETA